MAHEIDFAHFGQRRRRIGDGIRRQSIIVCGHIARRQSMTAPPRLAHLEKQFC
jgi:hypothetical protein